MAITNRERIGKAMEHLGKGLQPFVERELKSVLGDKWQDAAHEGRAAGKKIPVNWVDPQILLGVMWNRWNDIFNRTLGQQDRSLVSELRDARNKWAHNENFSGNDAQRVLDSAARLLTSVSASEAHEVEQMRMDLLRVQFDEQRRSEMRKTAVVPTAGQPQGGLKPWREVVTPHQDVSSGRYQQAEFAADLWQVYQNEGTDEYKHPTEFFRRTFLTEGLRHLLVRALQRAAGAGGDPVVELQTNFGGGKTHSMLAIWHLFSGAKSGEMPGVEELLEEAGVKIAGGVHRAVLVGTKISPGQPHKKPDGTVVRTLWGEIAWQLGGKAGYKMLKEADETATNPGDALKDLFNKYSPCVVLIDEWVAYARQLHERADLPAGTFDTQFTFAQTLTEAAKAARQTLLVVSIPASEDPRGRADGGVTDIEVGGERGRAALERLKNAIGRVESSWRPASPDEGFEIVRRRLFQPLSNDQARQRDAVARAFVEMYGAQPQEFPTECREVDYERRIKMAYPIHPELFDRLYNDWSTLDKFQRTRGVLRLMAAVIHSLWERNDGNLLIMPATVPIDGSEVQFELTRYMEDQWVPVIQADVDGANSTPLRLDRENPNLGRYSAARRIARTIYMGSAPMKGAANRGLDDRKIKLGCVQPGETAATFGDALRRLASKATYLYEDGNRYWYSTVPTVTRTAEDRATQVSDNDVDDEIITLVRKEAAHRADFAKVHPCLPGSDIPDQREVRLVILGPEHPHTGKSDASAARRECEKILDWRGNSARNYRNALVFLAPDANRLRELREAVRQHLAWASIVRDGSGENPALNLDSFQKRQADARCTSAKETVAARIPETYIWLIVPGQSDPKGGIEWMEYRLQSGGEALATRPSKKLKNEELLMTVIGGVRLKQELDRIPLWRGNHVEVKQLIEDVARYLYLPRLRDEDVLLLGIKDGVELLTWKDDAFAYAESWDETRQRYNGLRAGQTVRISEDSGGLLVKADVAAAQMEADRKPLDAPAGNSGGGAAEVGAGADAGPGAPVGAVGGGTPGAGDREPPPRELRRFHGAAAIDPLRLGRDASQIAEEIVQHFTRILGAQVEITLEIQVEMPEGAGDKLVRDVTENCRTLRFTSYGFEEL